MKKSEFLKVSLNVVKEKEITYGRTKAEHQKIADYWRMHIFNAYGLEPYLTSKDIAIMMILLKIVRLEKSTDHTDSVIDIAGYAACYAESLKVDEKKSSVQTHEPSSIPKMINSL